MLGFPAAATTVGNQSSPDGVVGDAEIVQRFHQCANRVVKLRHPRFFETIVCVGIHRRLVLRARKVNTCMRVVLCQRKNGLPLSLAFFMKSIESLTSSSSMVVM